MLNPHYNLHFHNYYLNNSVKNFKKNNKLIKTLSLLNIKQVIITNSTELINIHIYQNFL